MAAYASIVSLLNVIDHIHHHPHPPISLHQNQIQSLCENIIFLQQFLEGYSHGQGEETDELDLRLAKAACTAQDLIERQVVDKIIETSTNGLCKRGSHIHLDYGMKDVIKDLESIKKDLLKISLKKPIRLQLLKHSSTTLPGSSSLPPTTVGFGNLQIQIMDKLIGRISSLRVISIVGMGGSGKTTLAQDVYTNQFTVQYFDLRAWVTISLEYNILEIIFDILCQTSEKSREILSRMNEHKLSLELYQTLCGRRYLIVMDDMWDAEAWEKMKFFFPDNGTESRIMITTRLSNVALFGSHRFKMTLLDEHESWNLLCKKVFGQESCPNPELEVTGKEIANNCKGLPLSIVVIGGLLARSEISLQYWKYIAENLSSIVNSADDEHCLKILSMSYFNLPVHLRPCFLYVGSFYKDKKPIRVSKLIRFWVAEGFIKPVGNKFSEVLALEYLKDLVDRNLILVDQIGSTGNIKLCNIHDLLRDLCLREAQKARFLFVTRKHILDTLPKRDVDYSESRLLAEYLRRDFEADLSSLKNTDSYEKIEHNYHPESAFFNLVHSSYIALELRTKSNFSLPSSMNMLWNLQTLIITGVGFQTVAPSVIWIMPQLRHIECSRLHLPYPPSSSQSGEYSVLKNLQTLSTVRDLQFNEEVVKRIINIRKLKLYYQNSHRHQTSSYHHFINIGHLQKLESLHLYFHLFSKPNRSGLTQNLTFPHSLKKLTFYGGGLRWEDIRTFIGSLPVLEVLKLKRWSFKGSKWDPIEGQFCGLKFLLIDSCYDLKCWTAEGVHFPRLEHLVLRGLDKLKEVPQGIGDIPTLRMICLDYCSESSVESAKTMLEEKENDGECDIRVRVRLSERSEKIASFSSPNFQVEVEPWIPAV